jgi:hypothetical protein
MSAIGFRRVKSLRYILKAAESNLLTRTLLKEEFYSMRRVLQKLLKADLWPIGWYWVTIVIPPWSGN